MTDITDLARRFSRKLDTGKGMQLDAADLALLCAIGVNDVIQQAAAKYLREQCQQRIARNRSISGGRIASISVPDEPLKSSGMTSHESESEAVARALYQSQTPRQRSIASTLNRPAVTRSAPHADAKSKTAESSL